MNITGHDPNIIDMSTTASLYLIPVPLAEIEHGLCLPEYNAAIVRRTKHFVVENVRSARRFIKAVDRAIDIDQLHFYELNKHTSAADLVSYITPLLSGEDMGLVSEAGCPAVADPGSDLVALAHKRGIRVEPLVGPSSILLSLMASGFNGQGFSFKGYLPIDDRARIQTLKDLEQRATQQRETQIFIETPYRNDRMLEEILKHCRPTTRLCIACELTSPSSWIETKTLAQWAKAKPTIGKRPTIFLIGQ